MVVGDSLPAEDALEFMLRYELAQVGDEEGGAGRVAHPRLRRRRSHGRRQRRRRQEVRQRRVDRSERRCGVRHGQRGLQPIGLMLFPESKAFYKHPGFKRYNMNMKKNCSGVPLPKVDSVTWRITQGKQIRIFSHACQRKTRLSPVMDQHHDSSFNWSDYKQDLSPQLHRATIQVKAASDFWWHGKLFSD